MRLQIQLENVKESSDLFLPFDKQRKFLSFFKSIFSNTPIFEKVYPRKKQFSPFVFGVYFGSQLRTQENGILFKPPFSILFSTGDEMVFSHFFNGLMGQSEKPLSLGENQEVFVKSVQMPSNLPVSTDNAIFQLLSPAVMQNPRASKDDLDLFSPLPSEEAFESTLNIITEKKMHFFQVPGFVPIRVKPLSFRKVMVHHYGGFLRAFKGKMELRANPSTLQFLFDYGMGVRTGEGLGLLERLD